MTSVDATQLRRATPWYCWAVTEGTFHATIGEAHEHRPEGATRLLVQYRFDDDGSLVGRAKQVTA